MKGNKRKNYVVQIIFMLLLIVVLRRSKIPPIIAIIEGQSMQPALYDGDIVICNPFIREINRGDVVAIDVERYDIDPEIRMIGKRIIGMPGESIMIFNGDLYINNELYTERTMAGVYFNSNDNGYWELKSNEYFVLGDNIHNSSDSRLLGPFKKRDIKTVIKYKFSLPGRI